MYKYVLTVFAVKGPQYVTVSSNFRLLLLLLLLLLLSLLVALITIIILIRSLDPGGDSEDREELRMATISAKTLCS